MHVFIPVWFNAPLGGLQTHVVAQIRILRARGDRVTVMAPDGPFADAVRNEGATFLAMGEDLPEDDASRVLDQVGDSLDLVHAHPFRARQVGLEVARRASVPFVITLHSLYSDGLASYADEVDAVITVSAAARDRLIGETGIPIERVIVIPNSVDLARFRPAPRPPRTDPVVLVVSRFDRDKRFILDALEHTWAKQIETRAFDIAWVAAGDGTERQWLEERASRLDEAAGHRVVEFVGWQDESELAAHYANADLCVAPGLCALEAMACGTATVALGSKGYVGLIDGRTAFSGLHSNFGGRGHGDAAADPSCLFADIDRVIYDPAELARLGRLGRRLVKAFFDQNDAGTRLLNLYDFVVAGHDPDRVAARPWRLESRPVLSNWGESGSEPSSPWAFVGSRSGVGAQVASDGWLEVDVSVADGDKVYLTVGSQSFDRASERTADFAVAGGERYGVEVEAERSDSDDLNMSMWWIEYDGEGERLATLSSPVVPGRNRLNLVADTAAAFVRPALRFSGAGHARVSPFRVEVAGRTPPPSPHRRAAVPLESDYRGENLVFVVGPPRSGTTWLLRLIAGHPDVVAATEDNLGIAVRERQTMETNVFNVNRPFTDAQIRHRFHGLSLASSEPVVVEKTPAHLLYVDRIREVFPEAALVLIERDGRDVVYSLLQVGRDPDAWWSGAPSTVDDAFALWRRYAQAAARVRSHHDPISLTYEDLHADPAGTLASVLEPLGLRHSDAMVDALVSATADGKGIGIPGVFRAGRVGDWEIGLDEVERADLVARMHEYEASQAPGADRSSRSTS